jgi:LDH2 family malate/lactate/ureidoglycolate dehydrogenase
MKLNNNINRILLKEQSFPTYNINNNLILYPGEKEKITSKKRLKTGIPIDKELKTDFLFLADKYKVKINL